MRLFAVFLLLASNLVHANSFTVKSLPFNGEMPYVESGDQEVALKINTSIYFDMLEMAAPKSFNQGIKDVSEDVSKSQSDIRYDVWRNDGKILSIGISAEGCGAYCEGYTSYFNFDAANGERIEPSDIFTSAGLAALDKKLRQQRIARINKELTRLKQEIKKPKQATATDAEPDYSEDAIVMYEECKAGLMQIEKDENLQVSYSQMKFDKNELVFISGRCSNHAMRALDPLDIFENTFSLNEISPYLSAYGKKILPLSSVKK